jgi:hypothetical protein
VVAYIRAAETVEEVNKLTNEYLTEFNLPSK